MSTPEICWQPSAERIEQANMTKFAAFLASRTGRSFPDYGSLWDFSVSDLAGFWGGLAEYAGVHWHERPTEVLADASMPGARWFPGGTLNYAEHALDFGGDRDPAEIAVIETDESGYERQVSIGDLRAMVGAAEAGLVRMGVGAGDRVVALAPNRLEALVAFLATAALGAVWSSCSPDFGALSVIDRFTQISPKVLIAVDGYVYGGKEFDTSATVATLREALPDLAGVVHIPALGSSAPAGAISWAEFTAQAAEPRFTPVEFAAPLWVLYSSGTTGLPKPIVQSVGGILLEHVKMLRLHQDLGPGDRFFWFSTTGWMMWNYLVGGLLVGATVVLYDGNPGTPDLMTLWRLAAKHRIGTVGVSAAFIHACRAAGLTPSDELDVSCVRVVGSTGSPLSAAGFDWIMEHIGPQVQIASVSGGTDLCTAMVGAAPTVPVWRGEISVRALGAKVEAYDTAARPVVNEVGELVLTAPMPSMPVFLWGDADGSRLRSAYFEYFPGVWRHGDWIRITDRGSVVIEGRSDATLNRGGVRMGTAEFYRVVEDVDGITDSLVVDTSTPDGEGDLLLFVVLADGADVATAAAEVKSAIRSELSPRHVPGQVIPVPAVPRTLNGKKCEVPVKRILAGADVAQSISRDALADPAAFDAFLAAARAARVGA
ncbi:MAG: acetoacetate--CoA ligase [Actinobacteria bacterium 69-20]|nr:acetoacetate--CoA ligase [Actinomycetota bacterium]OJV28987.1 MAG: acetoacetate--CoA ligase [Actinobacteria bacterium 69-20]